MKVKDYKEIKSRPVPVEGASGVNMRWLISQKEAPNFAMRLFEIEKNGHTPLHTHPNEHEVFILEGQGELVFENTNPDGLSKGLQRDPDPENPVSSGRGRLCREIPFKAGYVVYVPQDKVHQFRNTGNGVLKFLCLIPNK